jgi:hypothetical protein
MGNITSKFPIPGTCDALGLHVNCTPAFDGNSPHVVMLGNVAPGNFEPDPDIAGKGVSHMAEF